MYVIRTKTEIWLHILHFHKVPRVRLNQTASSFFLFLAAFLEGWSGELRPRFLPKLFSAAYLLKRLSELE